MASPQKDNGFAPIANEILEALAKKRIPFSDHEWKILMFLFRKTYGWKKLNDIISLSQFAEGTGTQRTHTNRALQKLIKKNVVTQSGHTKEKKYTFQKDYSKWADVAQIGLIKGVTQSGLKGVAYLGEGVTKVDQKVWPKQAPTIDTTKETNKRNLKKDENQINLEEILTTMDLDIKNFRETGLSDEWIKKQYLGLSVPEVQIDRALGKVF